MRNFSFFLIGIHKGLIEWLIRFAMIIGKNFKIQFGYFDFRSGFAIEGRWIDAIAERIGSSFTLFFADILRISGIVKFVGDVFEVVIFLECFWLGNVVLLKFRVGGGMFHNSWLFFLVFFLYPILEVLEIEQKILNFTIGHQLVVLLTVWSSDLNWWVTSFYFVGWGRTVSYSYSVRLFDLRWTWFECYHLNDFKITI